LCQVVSLSRFGEDWLQEANVEVSKWRAAPAREGRSEYYYHVETMETSWVNPQKNALALLETQKENLQRLRDPEYLAELRYLETGGAAAAIPATDQNVKRSCGDDSTLGTSDRDGPGPGTPLNVNRARLEAALELLADSDDGSTGKATPQQNDAAGQTEEAAAYQEEHVSDEGLGHEGGGDSEDVLRERLLAVLLSRRVDTTRQADDTGAPSIEADFADAAAEECIEPSAVVPSDDTGAPSVEADFADATAEKCIEPSAIAPSEHARAGDCDKDDPPVLASCGSPENPDANVTDSMVRQLKEHDLVQDGTISRKKLHALLCGLGLGEAEVLQTLSAMAEQEWASEKFIDYAQFVAWVMEPKDAVAGLNGIVSEGRP